MLVDAVGVFLPNDPDGNAKLVFSILDCLPKANRVSVNLVMIIVIRDIIIVITAISVLISIEQIEGVCHNYDYDHYDHQHSHNSHSENLRYHDNFLQNNSNNCDNLSL